MRNLLIAIWEFASMRGFLFCFILLFFALAALKFSLSLILDSFSITCLGEHHLGLKFWEDLKASWTWVSKCLPRFWMFSITVPSIKLSAPFSISSFCGSLIIHTYYVLLMSFNSSQRLSSLFFFLYCPLTGLFWMAYLLFHRFFLLLDLVCCWYFLFHFFKFHSLYSLSPEFLFYDDF